MKARCFDCRFWNRREVSTEMSDERCQRNAPVLIRPPMRPEFPPYGEQPVIRGDQWCGQFESHLLGRIS